MGPVFGEGRGVGRGADGEAAEVRGAEVSELAFAGDLLEAGLAATAVEGKVGVLDRLALGLGAAEQERPAMSTFISVMTSSKRAEARVGVVWKLRLAWLPEPDMVAARASASIVSSPGGRPFDRAR